MIKLLRTAAFLLCTAVAAPVMAQDLDKGEAAFRAFDGETALTELRPLAETGNWNAAVMLAIMYRDGHGVIKDVAEVERYWRLTVLSGDANNQYGLGVNYELGDDVPKNMVEAVRLYRLAAEQGFSEAQHRLGMLYMDGKGVLQDTVLSHMWLNIASANGTVESGPARDRIATEMSPAAIEEAQRRARECMSSNYKNCGY